MRDERNLSVSVYPGDLIERYIKAIVGVPLHCWLAARQEEQKRGEVFTYKPIIKGASVAFINVFYAAMEPAKTPRGMIERVIFNPSTTRSLLSRDSATASTWDCSYTGRPWTVYKFHDVFASSIRLLRESNVKGLGRQRFGTSLITLYHMNENGKASPCKVPANLVGYDTLMPEIEVAAAFSPRLKIRDKVARYVFDRYPGCWCWVWNRGSEVKPITLEPVTVQGIEWDGQQRGIGMTRVHMVDVDEKVAVDDSSTVDADEVLGDLDD